MPGKVDETYNMPHGKSNPVRNNCGTLTLNLEETRAPRRKLTIEARAYNDGIAFRYIVPNQPILTELRLAGERTEFQLAKEATTWPLVLENFHTSYEDDYTHLPALRHPSRGSGGAALAGRTARCGVGGDHRGRYRQLRRHVPPAQRQRPARSLYSKLAPSAEDPGIAVSAATPVHFAVARGDDRRRARPA